MKTITLDAPPALGAVASWGWRDTAPGFARGQLTSDGKPTKEMPPRLTFRVLKRGGAVDENQIDLGCGGQAVKLADEITFIMDALLGPETANVEVWFVNPAAIPSKVPAAGGDTSGVFESIREFSRAVGDSLNPLNGLTSCSWAMLTIGPI